jgi:hypothetical protein
LGVCPDCLIGTLLKTLYMQQFEVTVTGAKNGLVIERKNGSTFVAERGLKAQLALLESITLLNMLGDSDGVKDRQKVKLTITIEPVN